MNSDLYFLAGSTPALSIAKSALLRRGCNVADHPGMAVTHLLLPVPSFEADGAIKGGGKLEPLLEQLPKTVTVFGGNLNQPELTGYKTVDFLQDPLYLAENAAITAHCAIKLALARLPVTLDGCHVLVIGWGRIGKCLSALLKAMGAKVTVAARKEADRAMVRALGYDAEDPARLSFGLMRYRVIFNTVPAPVLDADKAGHCRQDCLKIDLASVLGIAGDGVIWARGLPGKDAPETSGNLIARTAIRLAAGRRD